MRKNICVTPVHEKSIIIWNLNSTSLLCRRLNQILMATISSTSAFWEEIFLRWNVLRRDIFTLERSMFRNFYFRDFDYIDTLKRSGSVGNIKKGLSAEYAASTCVPDRYLFYANLLNFIIPNTVLRPFICKHGLSAE